jgi:EmrB/QacA subfamily drug resistance transporter
MSEANSRQKWLILVAIGVGTFMSALDGSVVNTLLPVMATDLHATIAGIEWVSTVYLLVVSSLLLGFGRAGDIYGNKRLYVLGFVVFVIGSALCGLAPTAGALIGLRGIQAIGAAMLFSNAPAILTKSFPPEQRGRALGALGTFTYLGLSVGPSLGGWLAGTFGWRSVFYINVPVGALAAIMAVMFIAHDPIEGKKERFDLKGATLFMLALVLLLGALNEGHAMGWMDTRIMGMFAASIVMFAAFIYVELHAQSPMLDLSLFSNLVFSSTTLSALLNYSSIFGVLFALPFLLIQGRGLTAQHAGLILTAQPIVMAIVAPMSGALSDKIGSRIPATVGMAILTGGILFLAATIRMSSLGLVAVALGVIGFGVGLFVSPNNSALMGAAPRQRQGIASGVLATARNVGMVLGIGISGAVFTTMMSRHADASQLAAMIVSVRMVLFVAALLAAIGTLTSAVRTKAA